MYNLVIDSYGYEELYNSPFGEMLVAAFGSPAPQPSDPVPVGFPGMPAVPPGTTAVVVLPDGVEEAVGPGSHNFRSGAPSARERELG